MSCIGLDSTNPAAVIAAVKTRMTWRSMAVRAAFGYKDGRWVWPEADKTTLRKMGVAVRNISAAGSPADIYDVETGDWSAAAAAAQCGADARAGHWPVVYVNRSNKAAVIADLAGEGLAPGQPAGRGFGLWVATLDGGFIDTDGSDLRAQAGVVAVQYAQSSSPVGTDDLDVSVITAAGEQWLGLAAPLARALAIIEQAQADIASAVKILQAEGA